MTTKSGSTVPGNRGGQQLSGLYEDRLKAPPSNRQRADEAASTLLALLPKLEEHGKDDETPEQTATTNRLLKLQIALGEHLSA